jgi:hypothetical protein
MSVLDLKTDSGICEPSQRLFQGRSAHVFRPACVLQGHGPHAIENLSALCCAVPRQLQYQAIHLYGSVPNNGFRATGVSREPTGYRSLPATHSCDSLADCESHGNPFSRPPIELMLSRPGLAPKHGWHSNGGCHPKHASHQHVLRNGT